LEERNQENFDLAGKDGCGYNIGDVIIKTSKYEYFKYFQNK